MLKEIADATPDKVKHFTIGFGRAGETPAAKGSGVLIRHGELHGILTCAHVDKHLRELKRPIGLVRLNLGLAQQSGSLNMDFQLRGRPRTLDQGGRRHRLHSPAAAPRWKHCQGLRFPRRRAKLRQAGARRLLVAYPSTLRLWARRTVHRRNDATRRQGDNVAQRRANVRQLA
jgi:hypothetical protein